LFAGPPTQAAYPGPSQSTFGQSGGPQGAAMRPPSVPFPGDTQGGAGSSSGQGLPPGKSTVYLIGKSARTAHMLGNL